MKGVKLFCEYFKIYFNCEQWSLEGDLPEIIPCQRFLSIIILSKKYNGFQTDWFQWKVENN